MTRVSLPQMQYCIESLKKKKKKTDQIKWDLKVEIQ